LNFSLPGCVRVVDELGGLFKADGVLSVEKLDDVFGGAEAEVLAG